MGIARYLLTNLCTHTFSQICLPSAKRKTPMWSRVIAAVFWFSDRPIIADHIISRLLCALFCQIMQLYSTREIVCKNKRKYMKVKMIILILFTVIFGINVRLIFNCIFGVLEFFDVQNISYLTIQPVPVQLSNFLAQKVMSKFSNIVITQSQKSGYFFF